jgi:BirA family biotin operon repressor/biotin-[acetyl-CoA-carboxylase] ligase
MSGAVTFVETTGSTNDDVKALARAGAPHGAAIVAGTQTSGRGRLGRSWASAPGNLHLSILARTTIPPERAGLTSLAAAVAVAEACGPMYRIKWPNDVVAPDGRKVAGILVEAETERGALQWVVIGVGVDVGVAPPDLPEATCLWAVDGQARDLRALAELTRIGVLVRIHAVASEPEAMLVRWRELSATLGQQVRVGDLVGLAVDVDPDGALRLRDPSGREHRVLTGDVVRLRPA